MATLSLSSVVSLIALVTTGTVATWVTCASDPPQAAIVVDAATGSDLIRSHVAREFTWRAKSARQFPGDVWSQDDDFFLSEQRWARSLWNKHQVAPGAVLLVLDAGLRSRDGIPNITVAACKPRLAYE